MDVCHLLVSFCNVVDTTPMWSFSNNTIVVALFTQGGVGVVSQVEAEFGPRLVNLLTKPHAVSASHSQYMYGF